MNSKKTRCKGLCTLVCALALLMSFSAIMAFADDGEIKTVGEMAGDDGIYEVFKPYLVQDTQKRNDDYVGRVQYTVYYDIAKGAITSGEKGTPIMIYSVNHPGVERIGTDSNATIIQSMLDRGYVVVVLDYLENAKAVPGVIEWSAQKFRYNLSEGGILTADIFPSGKYIENVAVPSGYNVLFKEVFFEIDKHSTSGTLEKIVENWNSDFKAVKGKNLVKWVHDDGTKKKVENASDGSSPTWHNADGSENASGEWTYVKYTVAETITDCVNPDGSFIDLDYYMNIVYPTNPEKEVPVGVAASSGGNISCLYEEERPQYIADAYRGYAHAVFDFLWTPMARTASWGYYDGSNGVTDDHINYGVQQYNDKLYNTAAIRYLRYVSVNGGDTYKFDLDKFFVVGNSKGGWYNFLGEEIIQSPIVEGTFATVLDKQKAVDKALSDLTPYRYYAGMAGETRYQLGEEIVSGDGITLAAGELQPWMLYENDCTYDASVKAGDEIISGIQASHPSNGSQQEDITAGHTPIVLGSNMADKYNAAYGYSNQVANICRQLDIPLLHFEIPLGHTLLSGSDLNYNVDTYALMYDFFDYLLKEEEIKVAYALPLNNSGGVAVTDTIVVKFAGIVMASEIEKVTVSSASEILSGTWSSLYGGTEWTFTPDFMKGGTEYTITVPAGLRGENGAQMKSDYKSTFITECNKADTDIDVTKNENGTYYSFVAPSLSEGNGFNFRFRVDNDAANTVSLYAVDSVSAASGALLGSVRVKGVGSYEIDISDHIVKNAGKSVTLLLKADNPSSRTVVKEESFDSYAPTSSKLTVTPGASIDGKTALKLSLENMVTVEGVSEYYTKSNSIFSISDITNGIKTTKENNGRRFVIELDIYDTISRTVRFSLNSMTNRVDYGTIDYDAIFFSMNTKANEWTHVSFVYEMYDSDYGFVSNNRTQKLTFYAATDGVKRSPIYYDNMTVTEVVTDVEFGNAFVAETDDGLGDYKAPENTEMPISIYNYNTLVGNYSSWKSALAAYKSGYTIKLNSDYTLIDSHLSDAIGSYERVNINLNGYTLASSNTKNSLLWLKAANVEKTTVNIYGGSVLLDKTPLASYGSGLSAGSGKKFDVNITDVAFGFVSGAFVTEFVSASLGTDGVDQEVRFALDNCSFVLRDGERAKDGVVVLPGSASENLALSYTVLGGCFYIDSQKLVTIADKAASVKFIEDDNGDHTELYASESMFTEFSYPLFSDMGYATYKRGDEIGENVVVYKLTVDESSTNYGIIPDEYADAEKYPFVLFDTNGSFMGAFDKLYGNNDSAVNSLREFYRENNTWNSNVGMHTGVGAVILQRRDYETSGETYYNWAQINGEFTIDLSGFTLTHNASGSGIFDLESKGSALDGMYFYPTSINVINGSIQTKDASVIRVKGTESTSSSANSIADKKFSISFDGVAFSLSDGATVSSMLVTHRGAGNTGYFEEGKPAPYFMSFNGCTFDLTNKPTGDFTIFNASTSTKWVEVKIDVAGCKVIGKDMNGVNIFTTNTTNGSSVRFIPGENGEYIKIESSDMNYTVESSFPTDDGMKFLIQDKTNKGNYTLGESEDPLVTKYGKLPEDYDAEKYPFALFCDGEFVGGYTHWANTADTDSGEDYKDVIQQAKNKVNGSSGAGKVVYILLFRDYALDSTEFAKDKNGTLANEKYNNYSQIGGTVVVDLGGYTLTLGAERFITANGKATSSVIHDSAMKFINGSIELGEKELLYYDSGSTLTDSKSFNVSFSGIRFICGERQGVSLISQGTFSGSAMLYANIEFDKCTFDYSAMPENSSAFTLFDLDDAELDANVKIKGGKIVATEENFSLIDFAKLGSHGEVTFVKDKNGLYTELYVPVGDTVELKKFATDEGDKYFVRSTEAELNGKEYRVYKLGDKILLEYAPKTSITLDNELVVNVYIPVNRTQMFTFDGIEYENLALVSDKVVMLGDGNNYYRLAVALGSAEAAKDIVLKAKVDIGGEGAIATFTFSVPKYAAKLISLGNEVEKTLAYDVLAYIRAAYEYFDEFNAAEEINRVTSLIDSMIGEYKGEPVSSGATNTVAPVTSVTLNLDARPSIRFYVNDTNVKFYFDGKKLNTVSGIDENGAYVELDVYAYALSGVITYGENGSYHVSDFVENSIGEEYHALAKAFLKYTESAEAYRSSKKIDAGASVNAEVVNKNGANATVTFVIDDGDQTTASFVKEMIIKYSNISASFAVPGKKIATLKIEDKDGDGIPSYVKVNGKYVYDVDKANYEFWCDVLSAGRSEIVNHSYTHGFFGSNDDGGTFEYVKNNQTTVTVSDVMPIGSVTKEIYATKQIYEELFANYLSKNKTMITYIGAGIGVRTSDYTLADGTVIKTYKSYLDSVLNKAYSNGDLIGVSSTFGQNYTPGFNFSTKVVTSANFTGDLRMKIPRYMIEYYNANPEGVENGDISNWTDFIDAAIELNGWSCFCIHKIRETIPANTSDHYISEAQAEKLFKYANDNNVWVATNSEAVMYFSEWSTSSVETEFTGDEIKVTLTDEEDNSIYSEELTVKVTIPASWGGVSLNGERLNVARNSDGSGYVLINIVPDSGTVTLVRA